MEVEVRVSDAGSPPLSTTVAFVVHLNVTGIQRLSGDDGPPTSTSVVLPLGLVAAAAVIVVVVCVMVARRVGGPLEQRPSTSYVAAPSAYVSQTSVDDLTCGADCSTDVAIGSSLRFQVRFIIVHSVTCRQW